MTTILNITLLTISGIALIKRISPRITWLETIGFSFPLALGILTFLMLLLDWIDIPLTLVTVSTLTAAMTTLSLLSLLPVRKQLFTTPKIKLPPTALNLVWITLMAVLVYMEYANFIKTTYYPTFDRDSMAGFDTIAYITAQEHTYHRMTIFDATYMPKLHGAGSYITYMPMLQLAYAYIYLLGENTSKLIPALFYLSFLIGFYGLIRRKVSHLGAAFATLGMFATPEMLSFSSLSNTNVIHACLASSGIIYICLWVSLGKKHDLLLGSLLLALNCYTRTEGVIFTLAGLCLVAWRILKTGKYSAFLPPMLSLLPVLIFAIYAITNDLTAQSIIITHPFWDSQKALSIARGAVFLLTSPYYGFTFLLVPCSLLLNIKATLIHLDNLHVLVTILISLLLYFLLLYQIDYIWDSLDNVINYSAKRFMFCYVPIAWYYIVTTKSSKDFFAFAEKKLSLVQLLK